MSGFWKFTSNYASRVTKILESEDISLDDLLDEKDTVSELLASNAKLIEYLRRPEILEKLVDYVVEDDEYQRKEIELDLEARETLEAEEEEKEHEKLEEADAVDTNKGNDDDKPNGSSISTDSSIEDKVKNQKEGQTEDQDRGVNDENVRKESGDENNANKNTEAADIDEKVEKSSIKENAEASQDSSSKEAEELVEQRQDDDEDSGNSDEDDEEEEEENEDEDDDEDDDDDDSNDSDDDDDDDDDDDEEEEMINEEETEVEKHTRRAQVAAEILSIDVWSITDAFMESVYLLQKLWCILDKPAPLPIFSATYFMKINEHLLDMKTDEMIQLIHQEPNLVERFMRHIETPPLMDFLLKVISTDKPDDSTGIIDVLKEQGLIPSLLSFLSDDIPSSIQSAAGDFLKAFITISANNAENTTIGPNELTRQLVSEPMVRLLLDMMLQGGTGLSNGVGIVIEIIRKNNSDYDPVPVVYVTVESHPPTPRDPIYLGTLVKVFAEKLPEFTKLLEKPMNKTLDTPFGTIEPLGFERFKICELVAELIHCSNMALLNDQKGEELVKERDEIREFLIEKHKEMTKRVEMDSSLSLEGTDMSKEIENLRLSRKSSDEEDDDDEDGNGDDNEKTSADGSLDDEKSLRENPVVGDQLKIALYDNKIVVTILDMFFNFPWNNFLHNVVFDIVQQILNATMEIGYNKHLAVDLFDRCHIAKLIVNGHNRCIEYEENTGLRLGYMGHLSLIAEEVVKFISLDIHHTTAKSSIIDEAIEDPEWKQYVDETLADIRNKYNAVLGSDGKQMNEHDMNLFQRVYGSGEYDDEEDDDDVILEGNDNMVNGYMDAEGNEVGSDKFSRYIGEEITGDLPDRFGSSDEESEDDDIRQRRNQMWADDDTDEIEGVVDSQMGGHPYHEMSAGGLDDENIDIDDEYDDDDDDDDENDDDNRDDSNSRYMVNDDYGDGYDDYEDPNDDGQSYKKMNHPLYQADGSLRAMSNEKFTDNDSKLDYTSD